MGTRNEMSWWHLCGRSFCPLHGVGGRVGGGGEGGERGMGGGEGAGGEGGGA